MSYSRDLPEPEIKPKSLAFRALTGIIFTAVPPGKPIVSTCYFKCESHKEYPLQKQANPNSSFKEDQRIIGVLPLFPCLHSPSPSSLLLCHFFLNYSFYYITPRALKDSLTLYCIYIYICHIWAISVPGWRGNGTPLQCSCLENPRDGGDWWAAVCGVVQSQTQLK